MKSLKQVFVLAGLGYLFFKIPIFFGDFLWSAAIGHSVVSTEARADEGDGDECRDAMNKRPIEICIRRK